MTVVCAISGANPAFLAVTRRVSHTRDGDRWFNDDAHGLDALPGGGFVASTGSLELGEMGVEVLQGMAPNLDPFEAAEALQRLRETEGPGLPHETEADLLTLWVILRPDGDGFSLWCLFSDGEFEDCSRVGRAMTSPVDSPAADDILHTFMEKAPRRTPRGRLRLIGESVDRMAELSDAVGQSLSAGLVRHEPDGVAHEMAELTTAEIGR